MKLSRQVINALAATHFLLGTRKGLSVLSNPEKLKFFLQGKASGTLDVGEFIVDASLGYAGAKRGEYFALQQDQTLVGRGLPFFYELPEYKDNSKKQLTPDFAVNMYSSEDRSNYRKTDVQHLLANEYLEEREAVFETDSTQWSTSIYQVTPKGNGLIRLEKYVQEQKEGQELSDLLLT